MGDKTGIEWTRDKHGRPGATWTPIRARNTATGRIGWHCEHASPGCVNCYSEALNRDRLGTRLPFKPGHRADIEVFLDEAMLLQPLRWQRPRNIFVCSMTDLFADFVPDWMIDRVFAVMALAKQHTLQVLTKRSARMRAYLSATGVAERISLIAASIVNENERLIRSPGHVLFRSEDGACRCVTPWPLPNVALGVSAEDQLRADERVPDLLATPAAVRFCSAEPLLGPIDFTTLRAPPLDLEDAPGRAHWLNALTGQHGVWLAMFKVGGEAMGGLRYGRLDQIIVGGESGPKARPMHPQWVRDIRDPCAAARVAFFFKQWGAWGPIPRLGEYEDAPSSKEWVWGGSSVSFMRKFGKARAGRLLDGVEHNGMPEVRA